MIDNLKICVIGHTKVNNKNEIIKKFSFLLHRIRQKCFVLTCLFGSKSEFNDLCYDVYFELSRKDTNMKSIFYRCKHETAWIKDKCLVNKQTFHFLGNETFREYDEIVLSKNLLNTTKNSYIQRNFNMIDDSDICIFYYNSNIKKI